MQRAEKNEFSDFEVIDTPDYTKSFDATANLDAWADASAQAEANAQARLADAKQAQAAQEKIFNLAPSLAKLYKQNQDANDKKYRNQARELNQKLLQAGYSINLRDLAAYNANEKNHNKVTGYFNEYAAKLDADGQSELAHEIRSLTGRRAKMMKRVLLMQTANNYEDDLYHSENGIASVSIARNGEPDLTWANAETTEERRMVLSRWRAEKGLNINDIGEFSDEFLEDIYYKKVRQNDERILKEASGEFKKLQQQAELNETQGVFIEAAKLNNGTLGAEVISWVEANQGTYGGPAGARLKAREILLGLLAADKIDVQQFHSIYQHAIEHRGTKGTTDIGVWKEFDPENPVLSTLIEAAEIKQAQNQEALRKAEDNKFVAHVHKTAKENGRPFTEQELTEIIQGYQAQNPGRPIPHEIKKNIYQTVEDQDDQHLVKEMEFRLEKGIPIGDIWMGIKGDDDLRKHWKGVAESELGQGLNPARAKKDKKMIKALVESHFDMTMGVSETQSPEFLLMLDNAESYYAAFYRDAPFESPTEKADFALTKVEEMIAKDDKRLKIKPTVDWEQSYNKKRQSALTHIKKNGHSSISKGILPGTEEDFKVLEQWAANPTDDIPYIYHVLAKAITNKPGYDGWDLANEQYRAVHGKDLPQPQAKKTLSKKSPIVQQLLTSYPSNATVTQATIHDKNNGNFNIEGAVLKGLDIDLEAAA